MSQVRDLFFDEFYDELERVTRDLQADQEEPGALPALYDTFLKHWTPHEADTDDRPHALISVDGGVQQSRYAYGGFIVVARALAITHTPGQQPSLSKTVKIHIQDTYDNRDRGFIPGYARTIAEYDAAAQAARKALDRGLKPLVLLDGSLYIARFPYAIREYRHHPVLLRDFFTSLADLRRLAYDNGFPLAAVSKDSTVFYLHMHLLRRALRDAGLSRVATLLNVAPTPLDLSFRMEAWDAADREALKPFLDARPLCDTHLVDECAPTEGYTRPLLLAPSIYYGRENAPALYTRIRRTLPAETAESIITSMSTFFQCPGVATTYWKPTADARPFRVDLAAHSLGHNEPWINQAGNRFHEGEAGPLEKVLNHLLHWYCNDVEYNLPLKQTDTLARFDRNLYTSRYESFIVRRLEEAGLDIRGTRRSMREID